MQLTESDGNMKRIVYFRADADSEIGYGHFTRTLALAEVLSNRYDCRFVTKSPSEFQRSCLKGICQLIELPSGQNRFDVFANKIEGGEIVVLDNYFYNEDYENRLRQKGASVLLIDNLHTRHSCADAVLGFAMGLKASEYSVEPYTKLFLGPGYSLLRKPFIEQLSKKHPAIEDYDGLKVVISFGGSERSGLASQIAQLLIESKRVRRITVIGNSLSTPGDKHIIFKNGLSASEMRDEFVNNDLAILPASTTIFEALACGILIIGGYIVDNQVINYSHILESGGIIGCGDFFNFFNHIQIRNIIESGTLKGYNPHCIIPSTVEQNLISIFESL